MGVKQASHPHHIALIVQGFGDDFSMGLTAGVQRAALLNNIFCSQYSSFVDELPPSEVEGPLIRFVLRSKAEGLLLFPVAQEIYNKELLRLADMDFPVVLLDRELIGLGFPCVQTDHRLTGRMAAEACVRAGHRRIAYCTAAAEIQPVIQRLEGYEGYLARAGVALWRGTPARRSGHIIAWRTTQIPIARRRDRRCQRHFRHYRSPVRSVGAG